MVDLIPDVASLKTSLEALSAPQVESFKQVSTYHRLTRALLTMGLVGLGLCVCSWIFYFNYFTIIHIAVNFLMVSVSLWVIIRPTANGFRVLAFALLICGLWNLFSTFYIGLAVFNVILAGIGLLQLAYAIQAYRLYQRFALLPAPKPTPELKQQYDTIWKAIARTKSNDTADFVHLTINTNQRWWQNLYSQNQVKPIYMLLLSNQAVLAYKARKWMEFIPKAELVIEIGEGYKVTISPTKPAVRNTAKTLSKNNTSINIYTRLNDEFFSGYIYETGLQSYIDWKNFTDFEALRTETFSKERQIHQRMRKGISTAALVYIFVAVILIIYVMQHLPQS